MRKIFTILLLCTGIFNIDSSAQTRELTRDQQAAALRKNSERWLPIVRPNLSQPVVFKRQPSACDTITTLFASNNGLDGAMFDVVAHTDITISYLNSNISASGDFNI